MGLIALRHPQVSARGICYGRWEAPLAASATAEIAAAVARITELAPVGEVLSSPALRCRALAEPVGKVLGRQVHYDDRLTELDFGTWEGRPWTGIPRHESDPWAEDPERRAPPGGESFGALMERVADCVTGRAQAVLITHAGPIRALHILGGTEDFTTAFARPVPYAEPLFLDPVLR